MCPFDRKPTTTSGNPTDLELSQNVKGILCPEASVPYQNTKLRENPMPMAVTDFILIGTRCCC